MNTLTYTITSQHISRSHLVLRLVSFYNLVERLPMCFCTDIVAIFLCTLENREHKGVITLCELWANSRVSVLTPERTLASRREARRLSEADRRLLAELSVCVCVYVSTAPFDIASVGLGTGRPWPSNTYTHTHTHTHTDTHTRTRTQCCRCLFFQKLKRWWNSYEDGVDGDVALTVPVMVVVIVVVVAEVVVG